MSDLVRDLLAARDRLLADPEPYRAEPILLHPRHYAERAAVHGPECGSWLVPGPAEAVALMCDCGTGPGR